jgi:hypothetical protein
VQWDSIFGTDASSKGFGRLFGKDRIDEAIGTPLESCNLAQAWDDLQSPMEIIRSQHVERGCL